jgi:hypothetical protein
MTPAEQAAFVEAYSNNVAHHSKSLVANFVARYESEENFDYSWDETSIVDALFMWHDAIKWKLEQQKGASNKDEAEDPKQIEIDNLKAELKYFYGGGK